MNKGVNCVLCVVFVVLAATSVAVEALPASLAAQDEGPKELQSAQMEANFMDDVVHNNNNDNNNDKGGEEQGKEGGGVNQVHPDKMEEAKQAQPTSQQPPKGDVNNAAMNEGSEPTLIEQQQPAAATSPELVIAIPSMRRWTKEHTPAPEQYLAPLVHAIWDQASAEERAKVQFLLLNVDKEPQLHTELTGLESHPGVRVITKHHQQQQPQEQPPTSSSETYMISGDRAVSREAYEWVAGETQDAPKLWLEASKLAPYVLFLEDDVKPTSQLLTKVFRTLHEMKEEGKGEFFMLDLYTPAISWGPKEAHNKERYPFECCTQAMLFNSKFIPELVDYELTHPNTPVDDNIRDWAKGSSEERGVFAMVPNGFEHIGRFSSNSEKSSETVEHTSLNFVP